jgi:hypothetical protein
MVLEKKSSNSDYQNIRVHITAAPHLVVEISAKTG